MSEADNGVLVHTKPLLLRRLPDAPAEFSPVPPLAAGTTPVSAIFGVVVGLVTVSGLSAVMLVTVPCPPFDMTISSLGSWLVSLSSLLSNSLSTLLPALGTSTIPLLGKTPLSQSFTTCVTSITTNELSLLTETPSTSALP